MTHLNLKNTDLDTSLIPSLSAFAHLSFVNLSSNKISSQQELEHLVLYLQNTKTLTTLKLDYINLCSETSLNEVTFFHKTRTKLNQVYQRIFEAIASLSKTVNSFRLSLKGNTSLANYWSDPAPLQSTHFLLTKKNLFLFSLCFQNSFPRYFLYKHTRISP